MNKYKCKVCGYIYEPEIGDPERKVESGTSFDDLPALWRCPRCGAGQVRFIKV